jgi:hypothetical protein
VAQQQPQQRKVSGRCFTGLQGFEKRTGVQNEALLQRNGPQSDRNQQVHSGGKRRRSSSPHKTKGTPMPMMLDRKHLKQQQTIP